MSNSKIEIKVGIVEFTGEGEQKWLSEQLDKVLAKVPELLKIELSAPNNGFGTKSALNSIENGLNNDQPNTIITQSLSTFLKEKKPSSRPDLFLATAIWIHDNQGKSRIQQKDINIELKQSSQVPIPNPNQEFARNVKKGYCVKDGSS